MKPYADTNFFTRLYLPLAESETAARLLAGAKAKRSSPLPITWLHRLEIINALQLHVFAGRSPGQTRITAEQAATAHATFRADLVEPAFLRLAPVSQTDLEANFEELALRHTAKHGCRTYDLVHVASAVMLSCDTFWSFDPKASRLAALEGLTVG